MRESAGKDPAWALTWVKTQHVYDRPDRPMPGIPAYTFWNLRTPAKAPALPTRRGERG